MRAGKKSSIKHGFVGIEFYLRGGLFASHFYGIRGNLHLGKDLMIHLFKRAGKNLVLDVGSGTVHILDPLSYDLLESLSQDDIITGDTDTLPPEIINRYGNDEIGEAIQELAQLVDDGLLYQDDSYTEFSDMIGLSPIKAMCLHVAHDCNLRCRYCFASTGGFGGNRKLMDFDIARAAIDFLVKESGSRKNLEVDFFGGEPLMNFDVVRETVDYARSIERVKGKNFRFTLTTNGMLLDEEITNYLNDNMDNIVLSVDGRKDVNDWMRPAPDKSGSYEKIIPKYQKLVSERNGKEYYLRGTFTRNNLDFYKDVIAINELGFDQISVEPVVSEDGCGYEIRREDIPKIERSYEILMQQIIEQKNTGALKYNFFHFMMDLENGPCAIKRIKGCGCGNEYIAVTPDGEIYPCHQFVGKTDFIMGKIQEGAVDIKMRNSFANASLLEKSACHDCWAKLFCSGGCNANNYSFNGSILKPYEISCELEKIRLECAIAIQASTTNV